MNTAERTHRKSSVTLHRTLAIITRRGSATQERYLLRYTQAHTSRRSWRDYCSDAGFTEAQTQRILDFVHPL